MYFLIKVVFQSFFISKLIMAELTLCLNFFLAYHPCCGLFMFYFFIFTLKHICVYVSIYIYIYIYL